MLKLNLGCGTDVREGFEGLDIKDYGQKYIQDVRKKWPFKNETVDEAYSRNLLPCLTDWNDKFERVKFWNELYRVLKPNASALIVIPNYSTSGSYGHPMFREVIKEEGFYFLDKDWRVVNSPDTEGLFTCNFMPTWGYSMHPAVATRNQEYQQYALAHYNNAALEIMLTVRKK